MVTKKARKILPTFSCQNFIIEKNHFSSHLILKNAPLELLIFFCANGLFIFFYPKLWINLRFPKLTTIDLLLVVLVVVVKELKIPS